MTRYRTHHRGMDTETESAGLFASASELRDAFERKLGELTGEDSLGVFILALANASFDPASFERLRPSLAAAFRQWCRRFDVADPLAIDAPVDDVVVFQRLRQLGFERLAATRWRQVGPWELQFNPMRSLRPPRMSHAVVDSLYRPFDPGGFHFNKAFLRRETLWEGELAGLPVRLLYNKFPFAELHGLLVPLPEDCRPQFLTEADHVFAWKLTGWLGQRLPGLGFGYNAQGALASINHLHLQMFVRTVGRYPIESPRWCHNGGGRAYPLVVQRLVDCSAAWEAIQRFHRDGHAYNLLYRPGVLYAVARAKQGSYGHSDWTNGFAWSELAGTITTSAPERFQHLTEGDLAAEFAGLAIRP